MTKTHFLWSARNVWARLHLLEQYTTYIWTPAVDKMGPNSEGGISASILRPDKVSATKDGDPSTTSYRLVGTNIYFRQTSLWIDMSFGKAWHGCANYQTYLSYTAVPGAWSESAPICFVATFSESLSCDSSPIVDVRKSESHTPVW